MLEDDAGTDFMAEDKTICPHCGKKMPKWMPPDGTSWDQLPQHVCFNDDCPYFVDGWKWMQAQYAQSLSYRHRYDPNTGFQGPLPVASPTALKECIIHDEG